MNKKQGLTLVELLCSLAILSIVMLCASTVFTSGLSMNKQISKDIEVEDSYRLLNATLAKDIKSSCSLLYISSEEFTTKNSSSQQTLKYSYNSSSKIVTIYKNSNPSGAVVWNSSKVFNYIEEFHCSVTNSGSKPDSVKLWGTISKNGAEKKFLFNFTCRIK